MISDPLAVLAVLAAVTALSIWLEARLRIVRAMSSVLTAILIAAILSNLGVVPFQSPIYDVLRNLGVPVAVTLILINVNLAQLSRAGPRMLAGFALACIATMVGALAATLVFGRAVGPEAWKLAGMYTGTYSGGSVNFAALGSAFETSPGLFVAANAADNVATFAWLAVCFALPVWLARAWRDVPVPAWRGDGGGDPTGEVAVAARSLTETPRGVTLWDIAALGLVTLTVITLATELGKRLPGVPFMVWVTTLALAAGQVPVIHRLAGGMVVGNYVLHLFLASIGASAALNEIARAGPAILWFALLLVTLHGIILYGLGRIARLDLGVLTVASQSTVGGPATAMAIAAAKGWSGLVAPGVAAGLLGYAVGTYLGWAVAMIAKGL